MSRIYSFIFFAACLTMATGCSPSLELKGLVRGEGVVLMDNAPVTEAMIAFYPTKNTDVSEPRPAFARTDEKGRFILNTLQANDGIYPGEYKVTATKKEVIQPKPQDATDSKEWVGHADMTKTIDFPKEYDLLPQKYNSIDTTPLVFIIDKKGNKNISIVIEK